MRSEQVALVSTLLAVFSLGTAFGVCLQMHVTTGRLETWAGFAAVLFGLVSVLALVAGSDNGMD